MKSMPCLEQKHGPSKFSSIPIADPSLYRSVVGTLQNLTTTRPDIQFAVNHACQFQKNPIYVHWSAVKRIFRYIKATVSHVITLHPISSFSLTAYSDADWLAARMVDPSATVSRSSVEAEYRAMAVTASKISWLLQLFKEINVCITKVSTIWYDNISTTYIAANQWFTVEPNTLSQSTTSFVIGLPKAVFKFLTF